MKVNMSNTDRSVRLIIVAVVAVLYWQNIIEGILAYVLLALAGVFVLTSLVNFCPLYSIFGISTCKIKK